MSDIEVHRNDEGTVFRLTVVESGVPLDISTATVTDLKIRKKDKTVFKVPMDFETDGTDGVLLYTSGSDTLDQKGGWAGQVYLEMPGGKWHTALFEFDVADIFEVTA